MANVTRNVGYAERVRLFKKDAMLFIASSSMGAFAYGTSNVVFNLYMVESGFGEDFLGFFLSVSMFGTAAIAIIAGILTDRRSRKNMVLASSLISVLAIFVQYTTLDPIGLILSQIFLGLSSAFNQVAWSPYITDLSTDEERAHLFGVNGGVSLLAVLGGNLLGGFIPGLLQNTLGIAVDLFWAYRFTLWLSLIPMALSAILVLPMTKDKPRESEDSFGLGNVKNWGFIGKYATSVSTVGLGAGMIVLFFNLFFEVEFTADASLIGVIFGINTVVLASGNFLAPALSDRLGKVRTVVLTEALSIPFLLMISWAPYLYLAVIAYVMRTVLMNMAGPVSHAFFMEKLAKEERATAMGIVRTGDSIVRGIAANIGGFLLAAGFYRLPYLLVSGLYVVGVVLFFVFFRSMDRKVSDISEINVIVKPDVDEPLDAT